MVQLRQQHEDATLLQPDFVVHPGATAPPLPLGLAARQIPRHPFANPVVQFREDPPALSVPKVMVPALQVSVHFLTDRSPLLARPLRASHPLPDGFAELSTCFPARPA